MLRVSVLYLWSYDESDAKLSVCTYDAVATHCQTQGAALAEAEDTDVHVIRYSAKSCT